MRLARYTALASIGPLLLAMSGCYRPYMSPYSAPYSYPSAPVQTLTPGGTYIPSYPQGTYPQGTFPTNPGSSPTPADSYSLPNSTYTPSDSNSNAPFYNNSTLPQGQQPYNPGGSVPPPRDAGEVRFQQSQPKPIATEPFNLNEQGSLQEAAATANVAKVNVDSAEFFEPIKTGSAQPTLADPEQFRVPGAQAPFAHDASAYRWLRGVARLNEFTGNWSLIYSIVNVEDERFHGWLTLAPDPRLDQLKSNGTYLVHGQLDETQTDSAGKPLYRVSSISSYTPSPSP